MANDKSFQLLRTNPALTGNVKVVVDSDYKIYLESYDSNRQLSNDKYKHYPMYKEQKYDLSVANFFYETPRNVVFGVKETEPADEMYDRYLYQFDPIYYAGASNIEDMWYKEEFEYHAPLFVKPEKLPQAFIIMRVDEPAVFDKNTGYVLDGLNKDNFREQIVDKWKNVSIVDMTVETDLGGWIDTNFVNNSRYPTKSFEFDAKKYNFTRWYGLDYETGVWGEKDLFLDDKLSYDQPHFRLERYITDGFKDNGLLYPHIVNFKFLFDDTPASPFELKKYSINRYYGFYVEDLEFVSYLTTYDPPKINTGVTLVNNIFVSVDDFKKPVYPFLESWNDSDRSYYVYGKGDIHEVKRNFEDGVYVYKIISDVILEIDDIDNKGVVDINYNNQGRVSYENTIEGRYVDLEIDTYINKSGKEEGLYGDLYLIEIDGKYHVLKYRDNIEAINFATGGTIFTYTGATNDLVANSSRIYVATDSGITVFDWEGVEIWQGDTSNSDLPSNKINSLYLDGVTLYAGTDKGIWIKTFANLAKEGNTILNTGNTNMPCDYVTKVYFNEYLVASCLSGNTYSWWTNYNNGGIDNISGNTGIVLDGSSINSFSIFQNNLYVIEGNRIRKYYAFEKEDYLEYNSTNTSLPDAIINDLYVEEGVIYVGTDKGFWLKNNQFEKTFDTNFGIPNNVKRIQVDTNNGYAYLSVSSGLTTDGIYLLNYFDNTVESFTNSGNGILLEPNSHFIKYGDDEIAIGSPYGMQIYNLPVNSASTFRLFDYYLNTDYAVSSTKDILEYWIESRESEFYTLKSIETGDEPLKYPIWRIKFCDIKDFDFDRVDTRYANFDYMQDNEYTITEEHKLYAIEYRDETEPKSFKVYETGKDIDKIINVSSEYIATDELWELTENNNLSPIWKKNQTVCKWGATDSISHSDYPYKMNNSYKVGSIHNRTVDVFSNFPDIALKNLDYFYRVGELMENSGGTLIHYYNQATNVETSAMNPDSRRFNLDHYIDSKFDYFLYFFDNYMHQRINNLDENLKSTQKYSIFNHGETLEAASTIFNGIQYNLLNVDDIVYEIDEDGEYVVKYVDRNETSEQQYNGYKMSVIFNPAYDYQTSEGKIDNHLIQPLVWYNPIYLKGYDFYFEPLDPPIRGFDSGATNQIELTFDNYSALTYYIEDDVRVSTLWEPKPQDEILYLKDTGQLYLKVNNNVTGVTLPNVLFEEIDLRGEFVIFSGSTYYISEDNTVIENFYKFDANPNERFISLTKWQSADFLNNYEDWIDSGVLYKRDNKLTNGGIIDSKAIIDNTKTSIDVFVNDIYENCLVVVNSPMLIQQKYNNINNVEIFDENYGLYYGLTTNNEDMFVTGETFGSIIDNTKIITGDQCPDNLNEISYNSEYRELYCATDDGLWIYEYDYNEGTLITQDDSEFPIFYNTLSNLSFAGDYIYVRDSINNIYSYNTETKIGGIISDEGICQDLYLDKTNNNVVSMLTTGGYLVYNTVSKTSQKISNTPLNATSFYQVNEDNNVIFAASTGIDYGLWYHDIENNITILINTATTTFDGDSITGDLLPYMQIDSLYTRGDYVVVTNDSSDNYWLFNFKTKVGKIYTILNSFNENLIYLDDNYIYLSFVDVGSLYIRRLKLDDSSYSTHAIGSFDELNQFIEKNGKLYIRVSGGLAPDNEIIITDIDFNNLFSFDDTFDGYTGINPNNCPESPMFFLSEEGSLYIVGENKSGSDSLIQKIEFNYGSENNYESDSILARNYVDTINGVNEAYGFNKTITYHHIDIDGNYKKYEMTGNTVSPFLLETKSPELIETKKESFNIEAILGPEYNIYNYQQPGKELEEGDIVDQPLARVITINEEVRENTPIQHGETPEFSNDVYRYNANYEPIFKRISIFNKTDYDVSGDDLKIYPRNYRFDDTYTNFATIDELIYSKVNEDEVVLKLRNVQDDKSIYPMVDEYGYAYTSRFIFKSNWDNDFYIRTTKNIK